MSMDLTGITNQNEYYTNHYFSSIFEENASETISAWRSKAKENEGAKTSWAKLRDVARQYYPIHDRFLRSKFDTQTLVNIRSLADMFLNALGYPEAKPQWIEVDDALKVPVYLELTKSNGAPALWVMLATSDDKEASILDKYCFAAEDIPDEGLYSVPASVLTDIPNEELVTKIMFNQAEPPRFILLIGMNQIALIDRNKWNEKRYLQFELEDIVSRHEESTLQAMAVLLHKDSLCPEEGTALLDELDANSQKHAVGVSQDLKYALRESIEILGNEVLYDMSTRQGRDLTADPVDAGELTLECLRYMYRMLFVLFIEARPELGYAPIQNQTYKSGYSLDNLRDIADDIRDDVTEVGNGYFLHETLSKLYDLIYNGYPKTEEELLKYSQEESLHDMFVIAPLKAHIFDPEYTKMITNAKLRNSCMLRIIDRMSLTQAKNNERRGRISYSNLGINQMGAVYEALLSYRGFIAEHTLYEVKRAGDSFNELDVGYFVTEDELDQYTEDERVRYEKDDPDGRYKKGQLHKYEKGTFIYRLAGREREKSASYYTPEVLTKCLVKYALKELLEGKSADEILHLTICEPAMGSAAFLNEAINQLAEAYLDKKQKERGEMIPANDRLKELQKVKMYMADRNVYGIDLNPVAVELAEVSLWLNTIYEGGFVPWFGTQLINGNSLIGARRQVYRVESLQATSKGLRWYENAPDRVPLGTKRMPRKQIYHFLLGDPGMCNYTDKVIKSLEPDKIKAMKNWNKKFTEAYSDDAIVTLLRLSAVIDELWDAQVNLRKEVEAKTQDKLSVYGYEDDINDSHTTIRQKDKILSKLYRSEHMRNAGPYARLKFAMDYWCALWFWPIDKVDLLPTREEFFCDLNWILVGTVQTAKGRASVGYDQLSMFDDTDEELQLIHRINELQGTAKTEVDIDSLCVLFPRLALARQIAEQNHFMHWELEYADLFAERGGFDLVIGNPPWILLRWDETAVLADNNPMFAIKKMTAAQTAKVRLAAIGKGIVRKSYYSEYEAIAGEQNILNAVMMYPSLTGMKANLYKCFLPQGWMYANTQGVCAFVHPEGVYNDPKGGNLRKDIYCRLKKHFQFENELNLFEGTNDHGRMKFSLNVYQNGQKIVLFETISNLFSPATIEDCYEWDGKSLLGGIKDSQGNWNLEGHPDRIIKITKKELSLFAKLFDGSEDWQSAKLPIIHAQSHVDVLGCFASVKSRLIDYSDTLATTTFWNETNAQENNILSNKIAFPESCSGEIFVGAYCGLANPCFQTVRREYNSSNDYDIIDLTEISDSYLPRSKYQIACSMTDYVKRIPRTPLGTPINESYVSVNREFVGIMAERTLLACLIPPQSAFINTLFGITMTDLSKLVLLNGMENSLPYDFFIKVLGKNHINYSTNMLFPVFEANQYKDLLIRALMLNCLTTHYSALWKNCWDDDFTKCKWSKSDNRLKRDKFAILTNSWEKDYALRTDYERRQALIEIDVISSMALGMTLGQLIAIYRSQFPVLFSNENDTWYDARGRIIYSSRSMGNLIYKRQEWENGIKGALAGRKFYRTITDDTMPGGPVERTIEYVAPFDRCDREKDYEIAWKFFEEKYGKR